MMNKNDNHAELSELLIALLEGTISSRDLSELDRQIINDPDVRKYYTEFLTVYTGLRQPGTAYISDLTLSANVSDEKTKGLALEELAEYEENGKTIEVERADKTIEKVLTKAEQEAIATILSDMDSEIEALETKVTKTRQIKQGMMHELLTGRIRLV